MRPLRFNEAPVSYNRFRHNWATFEGIFRPRYRKNMISIITEFSKDNLDLFRKVNLNKLNGILLLECVHSDETGKLKNYVVESTKYLRRSLEIDKNICNTCGKSDGCFRLQKFKIFNELQASLLIIYQIRNNINHHGKPELNKRNRSLVSFADDFMKQLLNPIFEKLVREKKK